MNTILALMMALDLQTTGTLQVVVVDGINTFEKTTDMPLTLDQESQIHYDYLIQQTWIHHEGKPSTRTHDRLFFVARKGMHKGLIQQVTADILDPADTVYWY